MNNDLISRSALLKVVQEHKQFLQKGLGEDAEFAYMSADSIMDKIKSMPTAYDVDKVVKRLNELKDIKIEIKCHCTGCVYSDRCDKIQEKMQITGDYDLCKLTVKDLIFDIIKSGGIERNS